MLGRVARYLQKSIFATSRISAIIGMAILVLLMLFITADVVMRRFFNAPVAGSYEITQLSLGVIVFTTLAYCAVRGAHISVDVLVSRFPLRMHPGTAIIIHLCTLAITGLISWRLFQHALKVKNMGEVSAIWGISIYPFVFLGGLCCAMLTLVFLVQFIKSIVEAKGQ